MGIESNIHTLRLRIREVALQVGRNPQEIQLIAVTKGMPITAIKEAYYYGLRDFAESRVVEAIEKKNALPADIRWHFIGKLQKNKISKVLGHFHLIHSVDSFELAKKLSESGVRQHLTTAILLEANTSGELSKGGLSPQQWEEHYRELLTFHGIKICGCMTMAPLTEDEGIIRRSFSELRHLKERL